MSYLMSNYSRIATEFSHGSGVYLFDKSGKKYLDALAGIAVCGLGHAHHELNEVLTEQANKLWHTSNIFAAPLQEQAAAELVKISNMDKVIFSNSGAEANEAAIKIARIHARKKGIDEPIILTFKGGFHGRTAGAMAATANPKIRAGFYPHLSGFLHLEFNNFAAIEAFRHNPNVVAVMFECVQGEGGLHPAEMAYVKNIRQICDEQNWLMICDEVQIGMSRSGKNYGFQHYEIQPDVCTMAKALGNGLPVGACLAKGDCAEYFQAGMHGSTFAGGHLTMAVVCKTLEIYRRDNLSAAAAEIGEYLMNKLRCELANMEIVRDIRGLGMMIGIELAKPIDNLVQKGLDKGIVINVTAQKVIRLLPPLIFSKDNCDELIGKLKDILQEQC